MHAHHPLDGNVVKLHGSGPLALRLLADKARFSLRIDPAQRDAASGVLGLNLPSAVGGMVSAREKTAVCLGPDEWYVTARAADKPQIEAGFAALYEREPHSLVDVSNREVGIGIEGPKAVLALQSAIAFDVGAMGIGAGCRTIFDGKAQIILLRDTKDRFQIEVWHSFSEHVWHFLQTVAREIELDI